ncbi:fumarylacetoacetate hydrolase family protein [Halalkalibacterium ligniniphilum]|uniref:fumarylacetoacetate hydrolase family protein n=1 Tax=Halalkalibacterium ligniniphilum TaxID=1134413 RepID=UPI0003488A0C|nr:fumarylacetoacetate hydrolase family protein [Halalkalibacterium ligniniphilum]
MKTLTFYSNGALKLGLETEAGVIDVESAAKQSELEDTPISVQQVIEGGEKALEKLRALQKKALEKGIQHLKLEELKLGPAVPAPSKLICIGLNYKRHADECNLPYPKEPVVFSKFSNALTGHKNEIVIPKEAHQVDYEVELAIIIGAKTKKISEQDALSAVYGYATANDVSARDWQFKSAQWLLGKTVDDFCPVGPYLVSKDQVLNPNKLLLKTEVNGEVRQNSTTADMIFSCEQIISYLSHHMTLCPGDIILTGTPEGVIMGEPEDKRNWLKDGDVVTVEVEGLGKLENTFRK